MHYLRRKNDTKNLQKELSGRKKSENKSTVLKDLFFYSIPVFKLKFYSFSCLKTAYKKCFFKCVFSKSSFKFISWKSKHFANDLKVLWLYWDYSRIYKNSIFVGLNFSNCNDFKLNDIELPFTAENLKSIEI